MALHDDVPIRILDLKVISREGESLLLEDERNDVGDTVGGVHSERRVERLKRTGGFLSEREDSH